MTYDSDSSIQKMTLSLSCPAAGCVGASAPQFAVTGFRFRLRDDFLPSVNKVTGFLAGGTVSGVAQGSFEATDRGGGVYQQELVIDDVGQGRTAVDDNGGSCRTPFVAQVPCKLAALGTTVFDTTKVRDGDHTVALRVYDATLDNVTTYGPVTVHVDNSAPAPPSGGGGTSTDEQPAATSSAEQLPAPPSSPAPTLSSPVASPAVQASSVTLPIRVVPRRDARVVHQSFGRPSTLQGRLLDSAGNPVAGTEVGAYTTLDVPGAKPKLTATAVTGPNGSYAIALPAGPSRHVTIRPTTRDATPWSFRTRVPAPIALTPSREHLRNGQKLVLIASLHGARVPARSADVAFQVLIGSQWQTFATRTFNRRGTASVTHRFRVTYHRMTYRFRALTLKRRSFPFEDARSRPVAVQVN